MREFFMLLLKFKIKELFFMPTDNGFLQFFRYAFVGGIAAVADWTALYFITLLGLHYLFSASIAFVIGLIVNFILSKKFVFNSQKSHFNVWGEFLGYAIIGLVGLLMTMAIMYLLTEKVGMYFMLSKILATIIVLLWNYIARKILIYKKKFE